MDLILENLENNPLVSIICMLMVAIMALVGVIGILWAKLSSERNNRDKQSLSNTKVFTGLAVSLKELSMEKSNVKDKLRDLTDSIRDLTHSIK